MHGQIRFQGRHSLPALAKRNAIKMDLPDKNGGAYGMIKGDLQKRNKTGIPGQCSPNVLPGLPSPYFGASIENNHLVPMGCYLFAVWKPYNDLCAVVSNNLSVTDALAIFK